MWIRKLREICFSGLCELDFKDILDPRVSTKTSRNLFSRFFIMGRFGGYFASSCVIEFFTIALSEWFVDI